MKAGVASFRQENEVQILSPLCSFPLGPIRAGGREGSLGLERSRLCDILCEHIGTPTDLCSRMK